MYAKDLSEPNYEFLIKKCKGAGIKHLNDPNSFIECSNTMDEVCENINDCNPNRKNTLILFDDKIADIVSNKKIQAVVNELFFRSRQVNISLVFIIQSYFSVPKYIRLNSNST